MLSPSASRCRTCWSPSRCTTRATTSSAWATSAAGWPGRPKPRRRDLPRLCRPKILSTKMARQGHRHRRHGCGPRWRARRTASRPAMELHAKYTLFAEGCRGHLGKQLIRKFNLDTEGRDHAALRHRHQGDLGDRPGQARSGAGGAHAGLAAGQRRLLGGGFLYHAREQPGLPRATSSRCATPIPSLEPVRGVPALQAASGDRQYLEGGKRLTYGARAMNKGGLQSLPKMSFPGGCWPVARRAR
jgi:flavin-dependent dehydrogenase